MNIPKLLHPHLCPHIQSPAVFLISVGGKSVFPVAETKNLQVLWLLFLSYPTCDVSENPSDSIFKIFSRIWLPFTTHCHLSAWVLSGLLSQLSPFATPQPEWTLKTQESCHSFARNSTSLNKSSSLGSFSCIWGCQSQAETKLQRRGIVVLVTELTAVSVLSLTKAQGFSETQKSQLRCSLQMHIEGMVFDKTPPSFLWWEWRLFYLILSLKVAVSILNTATVLYFPPFK